MHLAVHQCGVDIFNDGDALWCDGGMERRQNKSSGEKMSSSFGVSSSSSISSSSFLVSSTVNDNTGDGGKEKIVNPKDNRARKETKQLKATR